MPVRHTTHVVRVALLFLAGMTVFLIARRAFVPPDFGTLGYYRAGTLDDVEVGEGEPLLVDQHAGAAALAAAGVDRHHGRPDLVHDRDALGLGGPHRRVIGPRRRQDREQRRHGHGE